MALIKITDNKKGFVKHFIVYKARYPPNYPRKLPLAKAEYNKY
jgi:hypothetical protein